MRFLRTCFACSVMLTLPLSIRRTSDLSSSNVTLPTPLIHDPCPVASICIFCIWFSIWMAAPQWLTSLFFLVQIVACASLIWLLYHSYAPMYSNMFNIVTLLFSDDPLSSTCIHMEPSDHWPQCGSATSSGRSRSDCSILAWTCLGAASWYLLS